MGPRLLIVLGLSALACVDGAEPPGESERAASRAPLPNWATEEELRIQAEAGPPPSGVPRVAPPAGYRVPAEYEPVQAVLVTWIDYTTMLREIAGAVAASGAEVWAVGGPTSITGVPADRYRRLSFAFDSVWTRDYGPFGILEAGGGIGVVDPTYRHWSTRPDDDDIPCALAADLGVGCYGTSLILDGGNYMTDGKGNVFVTERIYDWNSSLGEAQVNQLLLDYLGAETLHVLPYAADGDGYPADGTGHIDMYAKLLAECKVLVADTTEAPFAAVVDAAAAYFASLECRPGETYQVVRIPAYVEGWGVWLTYTNSLIVNQAVIIPGYSSGDDATARAIYEAALPGYTVTVVNSDDSIVAGGSIHCVTREIPAVPVTGCQSPAECVLPHVAEATCTAGECGIAACAAGWGDCDLDPANGCEDDLSDPAHCGACDVACTPAQGCDPTTLECTLSCADADGDGVADEACGGTDCDDADARAHPGALETCDQVDEDCDGLVDEESVCDDPGPRDDGDDATGCACRISSTRRPATGALAVVLLALLAVCGKRRR